ncbi:hypothetical protein pipiens_006745 [Culex pipiens pipiens]|uniref:Odorant receptor n=1 Tax=Culex pipiens pipiens TaxID=38569 RepID=A0ABD1DP36_CULPP
MEIVKRLSKKQLFQHSYKDPSEYFASLLVLPNRIAGVAGLNVLSPDFKRFTPNLIGLVLTYVMFAGVSIVRVIVKVMLLCYAFTSISLILVPLLYTIQSGEKTLPFGFYIPQLDRDTWFGYFCNYAIQIYLTTYVSSLDMGTDCIYMMTLMSSFTQIDLLKMSLVEMNKMIDNEDKDLDNFFKQLSWYQGYVFIAFLSYQLFFGCFLGTLLAIKNEQLQHEIYRVTWYKLSIPNQKMLQFVLKSSQESVCMSLIFAPLDMSTYLQVYKSIYSLFTMLLTVEEE